MRIKARINMSSKLILFKILLAKGKFEYLYLTVEVRTPGAEEASGIFPSSF